ncbi:protein of unknown function [Shewanella benthica]|uniref:Uncharacterized protein n=1 Tax=Shewanella benthica TaxID=43661 RepID=A0A330M2I7_9GAMM|nr:protein of unknown function [Shewanella benthica]
MWFAHVALNVATTKIGYKKASLREALEFSLSFSHRNSASLDGGNKKESKKVIAKYFHLYKLKPVLCTVNENLCIIFKFIIKKSAPEVRFGMKRIKNQTENTS